MPEQTASSPDNDKPSREELQRKLRELLAEKEKRKKTSRFIYFGSLAALVYGLGFFAWAQIQATDFVESRYASRLDQFEAAQAFSEVARTNVEGISQAVKEASPQLTAQSGPDTRDQTIQRLTQALAHIDQLNADMGASLTNWERDLRAPERPITPFRLGMSLTTSAHAELYKPEKSGQKAAPNHQRSPAVEVNSARQATEFNAAREEYRLTREAEKLAFARMMSYAMIVMTGIFAAVGIACVFSGNEDRFMYGTNLLTAVSGYYFGAGITFMTVATG